MGFDGPMTRLLLVDDDDSTRMILRRFLQRAAPQLVVVEAHNGEDAIQRIANDPFDAVLSDYRMGLVSGLDVLAFALLRQPDAVRVLMTGFADPSLATAAKARAKVHAFIEKPISTREFEEVVRGSLLALLKLEPVAQPEA